MKKIFNFTVLWAGWECDSHGWVAEKEDGTRVIILTNHGEEYEAEISELDQRILYYQETIEETRKAIELVNGGRA